MATYTVEHSWTVPVIVQQEIEADSHEEAIAKARAMLENDEVDFDEQRVCWDASDNTELSGLWEGTRAWDGPDLLKEADSATVVPPSALDALREAEALLVGQREIGMWKDDAVGVGANVLSTVQAAIVAAEASCSPAS
jgi:hypothetical protein